MILTPASSVAVFPHVYKSLGYDAFKDFAPVTTVCSFPFLITVGPMVSADVGTLADFVKWCAANPKLATYGTAAAGSMLHFTGVTLAKAGRFEFVHLPYGGPGGIQDLIGGRIAATIYPIGTALPHVQSGAIRALATTGPQRSPRLPDVPTVREAGYKALENDEWFGVFVPQIHLRTVNRLKEAIRAVVNTDAFKTALAKLAIDPAGETPKEFAQLGQIRLRSLGTDRAGLRLYPRRLRRVMVFYLLTHRSTGRPTRFWAPFSQRDTRRSRKMT